MKTIDVNAKEWFDKANGNSYFSGIVIIDYKMKTEKTFKMPFQYGYGDHYEYMAGELLTEEGVITKNRLTALWRYCEENDIIYRRSKQENCKKREL